MADSELACLRVLKFALGNQLSVGVHYCSLENKHTGQVYQSNAFISAEPYYLFSSRDYFSKAPRCSVRTVLPSRQHCVRRVSRSVRISCTVFTIQS